MKHAALIEEAGNWVHDDMESKGMNVKHYTPYWRDSKHFVTEGPFISDALIALKKEGYALSDNPLENVKELRSEASTDESLLNKVQDVAALSLYLKEAELPASQKHVVREALHDRVNSLAKDIGLEKKHQNPSISY